MDETKVMTTIMRSRRSKAKVMERKEEIAEMRETALPKRKVVSGTDSHRILRPERLLASARKIKTSEQRYKRISRGAAFSTAAPFALSERVGLAVRTADSIGIPPVVNKALKKIGLESKYSAVFIIIDQSSWRTLHSLQDYLFFGYPSIETLSRLIHHRGHVKFQYIQQHASQDKGSDSKHMPITDNLIIEKYLANFGVYSIDGLIEALATASSTASREIINFLAPLKLSAPLTSYERNVLKYKDNAFGFQTDIDKCLIGMA